MGESVKLKAPLSSAPLAVAKAPRQSVERKGILAAAVGRLLGRGGCREAAAGEGESQRWPFSVAQFGPRKVISDHLLRPFLKIDQNRKTKTSKGSACN